MKQIRNKKSRRKSVSPVHGQFIEQLNVVQAHYVCSLPLLPFHYVFL